MPVSHPPFSFNGIHYTHVISGSLYLLQDHKPVLPSKRIALALSPSQVFASRCRKWPDEESEGLCVLVNPVKLDMYT